MAYCPKCNNKMATTEVVCPHCGYDFPGSDGSDAKHSTRRKRTKHLAFASEYQKKIPYSPFADFAIQASIFITAIGCVLIPLGGLAALSQGHALKAFVACPIAFIFQVGLLVVFKRVQKL